MPISPGLAAVAVVQQGQVRQHRFQAALCDARGDRRPGCGKRGAGQQRLDLQIPPVALAPANGHVDVMRREIDEVDQGLHAQRNLRVARDEGHEPGR
jgi:hypothetical protein